MRTRTLVFGLILIFLGLYWMGRTLDIIWFDFGDIFRVMIPLGLIVLGIWLILRKRRRLESDPYSSAAFGSTSPTGQETSGESSRFAGDAAHMAPPPPPPPPPPPRYAASPGDTGPRRAAEAPVGDGSGKVRYSKVLGDMFVDCNGINLHNVEISAGIGDVEIRLHGGQLSPGLNRVVISGFIGDVRVYLPRDMAYFAHSSNFVGDLEVGGQRVSGFSNHLEHRSAGYDQAEAKVYIAVNTFIGDSRVYEM